MSKVVPAEQLAYQRRFSEKIKEYYDVRGIKPLAYTLTFGCQQNEADTELIRGILAEAGFGFTDVQEEADLFLVNTCAIREHAEMRALGNIGSLVHLKRKKREGIITAVCGCMAQEEGIAETIKKSYPYVDMVFGTHAIQRLPELLYKRLTAGKRVFDTEGEGVIIEGVEPIRKEGVKAWLSIMYGCNNFCTYCIVPYVRGRERSRDPEEIEADLRTLVAAGYKDITLLGQNVNSYGHDLGLDMDFADLLKRLAAVPGDFSLRFMTSHPKDATKKLFDTMASSPKICKAIHLPVQCGSNRILQEMNRRYTTEKYLELVDYARSVMPDIAITSDIIVGFPGEQADDFEGTMELVRRVRFDSLFTFIYSPRPGTVAARLPDPVSRQEKQVWFDRLVELQNTVSREKNESFAGKTVEVLIDGEDGEGEYTVSARTDGNKLTLLRDGRELVGKRVKAYIEKVSTFALYGRLADE